MIMANASLPGPDDETRAMEMLLGPWAQAMQDPQVSQLSTDHGQAARVLDFLAQACENAQENLQSVSYEDVAARLGTAVKATQRNLQQMHGNMQEMLADPNKMHALWEHVQRMDEPLLMMQLEAQGNEEEKQMPMDMTVASEEENLRHLMEFTDCMCTIMDRALSSITSDECELAAHLSLNIASRLLEVSHQYVIKIWIKC